MELRPNFENLGRPEVFISHIEQLKERLRDQKKTETNPFPVEVFPRPIQEIIKATNESLNYPIDFIGASILYAISVSIGNTHRAELKNGWHESAVLYLSIVGRPGTNKSHPISFALRPIERRDSLKYQEYLSKKREYDANFGLTKKDRERQGFADPIKPIWEQHLVTDFTPEALAEIHKFNKRGIGVYVDELASWFGNFNRYNKGSEEQFWLSVWSGKPMRINRKTSEPILIPLPFISVIGTIQPGVLNDLAANRTENGFLDRLLFVAPDSLKKDYWSQSELSRTIVESWDAIISNILDIAVNQDETGYPKPQTLGFTPEAKERLWVWQRESTDLSNESQNLALGGIYAKIEVYAIRLALCLEVIKYACDESKKDSIGIESVEGAISLVEYFKNTAIKVHSLILNADPLAKLPDDKQALIHALPNNFTTKEGLKIAESMGIPERTFKRFLKKRDLFSSNTRGQYEKLN